jgi:hypothetical protein
MKLPIILRHDIRTYKNILQLSEHPMRWIVSADDNIRQYMTCK